MGLFDRQEMIPFSATNTDVDFYILVVYSYSKAELWSRCINIDNLRSVQCEDRKPNAFLYLIIVDKIDNLSRYKWLLRDFKSI